MGQRPRALGYGRVSTERQAEEDKVSLPEQRREFEEYCVQRGYDVVGWIQDVGSGASKRRKGLQRVLKMAQEREFDVLVAWKSDRLSRGMYPAAALMEAVEGTKIRLEAVKDTIDLNTFGILAAVGKVELENIRDRAKMGAIGRARRGRLWGDLRYGYKLGENKEPIIDEDEAPVVARIFIAYTHLTKPVDIVEQLHAESIFTRHGNFWTTDEIWRTIKDPIYKGEGHFNRRTYYLKDDGEREVKHREFNPKDEWIQR